MFLNNLKFDENGNLSVLVDIDENNIHDISLDFYTSACER